MTPMTLMATSGITPYGHAPADDDGRYREPERKTDQQILEDALYPFGRPNPVDRLVDQLRRDAEDRIHAREACNFIDRNPAAQQRCYDSLR